VTTASILTRISVDADSSDSVERQERELRALAEHLGAVVGAIHADVGVSGVAKARPALDAWLADALDGRADLLLAWDWSRISRTGLRSVARVLDVLETSGARLVTLRDNLDSATPAFNIITAVMAETAKSEREAIASRVRSRQAADRAKGRWTKPRPFGYEVRDGKLVQHRSEAAILRALVKRYLDGESLRSLTIWLNESGIAPPRAQTWGLSSVRHILYSPSSAGMLPHRGDVVRGDDGQPLILAAKPVITIAQHRAVLERPTVKPSVRGRRPAGARHPLSGMVRCALCGAAVVYQSRAGSGRRPNFRCVGRAQGNGCEGLYVGADALLAEVVAKVSGRLAAEDTDSDWFGDVAVRLGMVDPTVSTAELTAAREERTEVAARLAEAEDAYFGGRAFRGADGKARFAKLGADLGARLDALDAVLAQERPVVDVGPLLDLILGEMDDDALRALLQATVDTVRVGRDASEVDWR
jgi:DNA invertase Pin-like site-specific DNA recombinase